MEHNKIEKIDNLTIINGRSCIKKGNKDTIDILNYLKSKDFNNYIDTKYEKGNLIRQYIEEIKISDEDKISELMYIISLLHNKTTFYKNMSLDEIKEYYETETDKIIENKMFYEKLCEKNDSNLFMPPSMNLLVDKISLFLISFDTSKYYLDKWYSIIKDKKRKRVVMNHNNLKISNFIVGEYPYLINWDNSIIDSPVIDIVSLFKNNYKIIDMEDLSNLYNSKYQLLEEEKYLLYSKLFKVEKLELSNNEILNTRNVYNKVLYLERITEFLKNNMK